MTACEYLEQLGFHHNNKAFGYIEDAVEMINGGYSGGVMAMYEEIAARHGKKGDHIERAIRASMDTALLNNPRFFCILRLPETRWGGKFTNSEFLYTLARRVKEDGRI